MDKPNLAKLYISQTGNLELCNKDKASLRSWVLKQKEIYHDH